MRRLILSTLALLLAIPASAQIAIDRQTKGVLPVDRYMNYGVDTGTVNAYAVAVPMPNGLVPVQVRVAIGTTNTGASTLAVGGTAATAIMKRTPGSGLAALVGGELQGGYVYAFDYKDGVWQVTPISLGSASAIGPLYALQAAAAGGAFNGTAFATLDTNGDINLTGAVNNPASLNAPIVNGVFNIGGFGSCTYGTTLYSSNPADCAIAAAQSYEQHNNIQATVVVPPTSNSFKYPINEDGQYRMNIIGATRKNSTLLYVGSNTGGLEDDFAFNWGCSTSTLPNPVHFASVTLAGNQNAGGTFGLNASKIGSLDNINITGAIGVSNSDPNANPNGITPNRGETFRNGYNGCSGAIATVTMSGTPTGMTAGVYNVTATGGGCSVEPTARFLVSAPNYLDSVVVTFRGSGCSSAPSFQSAAATAIGGTLPTLTTNLASSIGNAEMFANDVYINGQGGLPKQWAELTCTLPNSTTPTCSLTQYPYLFSTTSGSTNVTFPTIPIASDSVTGGIATFNTTNPHNLQAGDIVYFTSLRSGMTSLNSSSIFYNVRASGLTSTSFTVTAPVTTVASASETGNVRLANQPYAPINGTLITGGTGGIPANTTLASSTASGTYIVSGVLSTPATSTGIFRATMPYTGDYQNRYPILYVDGGGATAGGASNHQSFTSSSPVDQVQTGGACAVNGTIPVTMTAIPGSSHYTLLPSGIGTATGYSGCLTDQSAGTKPGQFTLTGIYGELMDMPPLAWCMNEVSVTDSQFNQLALANCGQTASYKNDNNGNTYIAEHPIQSRICAVDVPGSSHYGIDGDSCNYQFWLQGATTVNGLGEYHALCADTSLSCYGPTGIAVFDGGVGTNVAQVHLSSSDLLDPGNDYHPWWNAAAGTGPVDYNDAANWPVFTEEMLNTNVDARTCYETPLGGTAVAGPCPYFHSWQENKIPTNLHAASFDVQYGSNFAGAVNTGGGGAFFGTVPATYTVTSGGTGYTTATGVPVTGGSGNNLGLVDLVVSGGVIQSATPNATTPGLFYHVGDSLTVVQAGGSGGVLNLAKTSGDVNVGGSMVAYAYRFPVNDASATIFGPLGRSIYLGANLEPQLALNAAGTLTPYVTAYTVTSSSVTSNVATLNFSNSFQGGETITFAGLTNIPILNGTTKTITTATGSSIQVAVTNADVASATETGTVTWVQNLGSSTKRFSNVYTGNTDTTTLTFGGVALTTVQGTDTKLQTAGTNNGATNAPLCNDALGGATTTCTNPWLATANNYTATQAATLFQSSSFRGTGSANVSVGPTGLYNLNLYAQSADRVDLTGGALQPNSNQLLNLGTSSLNYGAVYSDHYTSNGTAPTIAVGAGLGSGGTPTATISASSNNTAGAITLATGTGTAASSVAATITLATYLVGGVATTPTPNRCTIGPGSSNGSAQYLSFYVPQPTGASGQFVIMTSAAAPAASTTGITFQYICSY